MDLEISHVVIPRVVDIRWSAADADLVPRRGIDRAAVTKAAFVDLDAGAAGLAGLKREMLLTKSCSIASPMHYVTGLRMMEAEHLLRDRRLSVSQVAERMGYGT
jgi:hypothetical protein